MKPIYSLHQHKCDILQGKMYTTLNHKVDYNNFIHSIMDKMIVIYMYINIIISISSITTYIKLILTKK